MVSWKGKKIAVLGLLKPGVAAIRFAHKLGAQVKAFGVATEKDVSQIKAELKGVRFELETEDIPLRALEGFDAILQTPGGGRRYKAQIQHAREQGVKIKSDLEVACQWFKAPLIAVTGTNGKSTVLTLIKDLLEASGKSLVMAGGPWPPFLEVVTGKKKYDYVLLELNSSRLMRVESIHPFIAVLLNIYPGHAERHASFEEYAKVKAKIYSNQGPEDFFIHQVSDSIEKLMKEIPCRAERVPFFYGGKITRGAFVEPGSMSLHYISERGDKEIYHANDPILHAPHLMENVMAALLVGKICNCPTEHLQNLLDKPKFPMGRLELVKKIDGIPYYSDAWARNVAATNGSLRLFEDKSVVLVAGGECRANQFYESLNPIIKQKVRLLILFGNFRREFHKIWGDACESYVVPDLKSAMQLVAQKVKEGDNVLFSPATTYEVSVHGGPKSAHLEFIKEVDRIMKATHLRKKVIQRI